MSQNVQAFEITDIPPRTPITLTSSTKVRIPNKHRVRLKGTHRPQTLRFSTKSAAMIKIAIYNPTHERVHYLKTEKKHPVLYQLQNLEHVDVVPQSLNAHPSASLEVTSDRPLEISH